MTTFWIYFGFFIVLLAVISAVVIIALKSANHREILLGAAALIVALAAVILTEALTTLDKYTADRAAAAVLLNDAMLQHLMQYRSTDVWIWYINQDWDDSENRLTQVNIQPLAIYDTLSANGKLALFVDRRMFYYLAYAKSNEEALLGKVRDATKGHVNERFGSLKLYKDLLSHSWQRLCEQRQSISPDDRELETLSNEKTLLDKQPSGDREVRCKIDIAIKQMDRDKASFDSEPEQVSR